MKDKILEAVQISKTYGEGESAVHALRNSDLTLENGTFASIIGSSGSGKTVLSISAGCKCSHSFLEMGRLFRCSYI